MTTFILDVLTDLKKQDVNFSELTFILPSKRAGIFLKHELHKVVDQTLFAPDIISIEEFTEDLSQLKSISNTELLFEFYTSYLQHTKANERDSFETYSKWAQILLQDFNEIDRYLIPQKQIFHYLSAIEDLKHWSLEEPKTAFVKRYLSFWNNLFSYYSVFSNHLKQKKIGYQGLIYREAVNHIEDYIKANPKKQHVFLGFNALNTAEEFIIQALLRDNLAKVYWDIDHFFFNNEKHDASFFTRQHKKNWRHYDKNPFNCVPQNYIKQKNISVFAIPKNVGQAKQIGSLLDKIQSINKTLQNTAVVLGDENLLIPVLNSIPEDINSINITMGYPLKSIPLASLFEGLLNLHKNNSNSFYYKDIINIISHQFIRPLLQIDGQDFASILIDAIEHNNLIFIKHSRLKELSQSANHIIDLLFLDWNISIEKTIKNCSTLILSIKSHLNEDKAANLLSLEYLFRFNALFNELSRLNATYHHINDLNTLHSLYKDLLSSETLDFQGEPLQGLQIMGMLESRVLDFETVIISSVNEGILPSGKSNNSFIPFDVKLENNLPTYKEKDAVYTYHFYRLIQRAKNVFILYNTEADILTGGEKSRLITQLELEGIHYIHQETVTPQVPTLVNSLNVIPKTPELQQSIIQLAGLGFSPSSLTNYMRNPIDFYYQKILKINTHITVEETVAANTLGTVVHNTLEDFYKPLQGKVLSIDLLKTMKSKISDRVAYHFQQEYKEGDINKGKNLIIFEIAKRYVSNFLDYEIKAISDGNTIKIMSIEADNQVKINIPEFDFPVILKGKVDRVDEYNGITRIIDYKTGSVMTNQVEIVNWEDLTTDYKKYSKSFQVLAYAYMMHESNTINLPAEAGIISFKNLSSGFIKFSKKESTKTRAKNSLITAETLEAFKFELTKLILEICNPEIDFIEKEI
ncbi:PD-(D/E)XK nuclease family protein [Algibacter mikhailovii]|uniref:PD-(D/E)XK endonuclease-like domain-containing protein n=1 Tax=Algibacter mikhailovii TaxID=425498 RepID=A0A918V6W4_9FLAO|nr:PD-(D/E)XK nuclease family protein [Algibacter mikhailovii]GGZ74951.1 hypothetical protein GCM10007028_10450 [Algibacter mikhailovii]